MCPPGAFAKKKEKSSLKCVGARGKMGDRILFTETRVVLPLIRKLQCLPKTNGRTHSLVKFQSHPR